MEVGREERTEHTVDKARCENLIVTCLALALGETTGEASCCCILLSVVYLQRHKICTRNGIFCGTNGGQKNGVAHTEHTRTVALFCHFSGLDGDGSSISQRNCFRNYVHLKF